MEIGSPWLTCNIYISLSLSLKMDFIQIHHRNSTNSQAIKAPTFVFSLVSCLVKSGIQTTQPLTIPQNDNFRPYAFLLMSPSSHGTEFRTVFPLRGTSGLGGGVDPLGVRGSLGGRGETEKRERNLCRERGSALRTSTKSKMAV